MCLAGTTCWPLDRWTFTEMRPFLSLKKRKKKKEKNKEKKKYNTISWVKPRKKNNIGLFINEKTIF